MPLSVEMQLHAFVAVFNSALSEVRLHQPVVNDRRIPL